MYSMIITITMKHSTKRRILRLSISLTSLRREVANRRSTAHILLPGLLRWPLSRLALFYPLRCVLSNYFTESHFGLLQNTGRSADVKHVSKGILIDEAASLAYNNNEERTTHTVSSSWFQQKMWQSHKSLLSLVRSGGRFFYVLGLFFPGGLPNAWDRGQSPVPDTAGQKPLPVCEALQNL